MRIARWLGAGLLRAGAGLLLAVAGVASADELARIPQQLPGAPPLPAATRQALARELAERGSGYSPRTRQLQPDGSPRFTNRLLLEQSPYLQQHAHNPVDWRPWGDEAFADARRLGRPLMISIGYSTCHWCHVMEEESFDDVEIATEINRHFIAIKVDREVRPDIDAVYMAAIQAMSGSGGWPLNVWATPDGRPFYAVTYVPPVDRGGRPGLPTLLRSIHERYTADPDRIQELGQRLESAIRDQLAGGSADATRAASADSLRSALDVYRQRADRRWGGLSGAPKFPSSLPARLLLRIHRRSGDPDALELARISLERMAAGGIYDQIGGGFHRYSTDARWLVPHFEKMLYDNALLAVAYLEAWQATGHEPFARVTRETLGYVAREMTSAQGGFYSATDADSPTPSGESEEGWFFTWTPGELEAALGADSARLVAAYYGVSAAGNFEGRNILHVGRPLPEVARELELAPGLLEAKLAAARETLYAVRAKRPAPLRDHKILAGWNGLMISAFARAGFALGEPELTAAAARAADFVLGSMRPGGRLARVHIEGAASGPAFLEDYAFLIAGLLDLYESDGRPRWLREALALQAVLDARYADAAGGGYFGSADDGERLLAREKPTQDGAIPSGNSVAALNLLRLAEFTGESAPLERATLLLSAFHDTLTRAPTALSELLIALDYHLDLVKEVVLVRPADGDAAPMLAPLRTVYAPNRIVAVVTEGAELEEHAALVPVVAGKRAIAGRVTAYVCENRVCQYPTSDPETFAEQLGTAAPLE